jgi:hypothetical protein
MNNNYEILTVTLPTTRDLIKTEVEALINKAKIHLAEVKHVAITEAWKILQLTTATIIQIIESIGYDLTGPDKKALAMDLIGKFYDSVFNSIDIPLVPNIIEPLVHKYTKTFLMMLVSATIDALVTTFRNVGIFKKSSGNS